MTILMKSEKTIFTFDYYAEEGGRKDMYIEEK